jgi:flagellar FliL protein
MSCRTVHRQPATGRSGGDQYLQLAFTLEVRVRKRARRQGQYGQGAQPHAAAVSSKRAADINTPEGKVQLAKEIIAQLREPFEDRGAPQEIEDVLFTSFIIQ